MAATSAYVTELLRQDVLTRAQHDKMLALLIEDLDASRHSNTEAARAARAARPRMTITEETTGGVQQM